MRAIGIARPSAAMGSPLRFGFSATRACILLSPSTGLPSTHNPILSWVWLWQFPGEVRGGGWGDVSSWGRGQAWLPLWKSPTPAPLHSRAGGRHPLHCRNRTHICPVHPFSCPTSDVSRCPG